MSDARLAKRDCNDREVQRWCLDRHHCCTLALETTVNQAPRARLSLDAGLMRDMFRDTPKYMCLSWLQRVRGCAGYSHVSDTWISQLIGPKTCHKEGTRACAVSAHILHVQGSQLPDSSVV